MEQQLIQLLRENPDFLHRHPELLPRVANDGDNLIDLQSMRQERLERDLSELREQMAEMLRQTKRNTEIYHAFHQIIRKLVIAKSPGELIEGFTIDLENMFAINRVSVALNRSIWSEERITALREQESGLAGRLFAIPQRELFATVGEHGSVMIRIGMEGKNRHLLFGEDSANIRSEALVPLKMDGVVAGSINLGGAFPSRFLPSYSTDLLQDLAGVFNICLQKIFPPA